MGRSFFGSAAIAARVVAAVVVSAAAVVATAAGKQQDQDDDPPAGVATEAVVVAHNEYLQEIFSSVLPLIPEYSAAKKRCNTDAVIPRSIEDATWESPKASGDCHTSVRTGSQ